jgi:hypothetical protein
MKIVICGSMNFSKEMLSLKNELNSLGFDEVVIPHNTERYASSELREETRSESTKNKIEKDLIRVYYQEISAADAVIVANYDKSGIKNYVGGNSFLEAAFAHVLNKKLYFLFAIPEMIYADELQALQPVILNGDLNLIV